MYNSGFIHIKPEETKINLNLKQIRTKNSIFCIYKRKRNTIELR